MPQSIDNTKNINLKNLTEYDAELKKYIGGLGLGMSESDIQNIITQNTISISENLEFESLEKMEV